MNIYDSAQRAWWELVKRFNRRSYLKHLADLDPEGEDQTVHEDFLYYESQYWTRRAERVHVSVVDIPLPEGEQHWQTGYDETRYLRWDSLRKLKKLAQDAEYEYTRQKRERRELWVKYITALAACVAAAASIANLIISAHR